MLFLANGHHTACPTWNLITSHCEDCDLVAGSTNGLLLVSTGMRDEIVYLNVNISCHSCITSAAKQNMGMHMFAFCNPLHHDMLPQLVQKKSV